MSNKPKVYVAGTGVITAIGGNTKMTAASAKAGINRYSETDRLTGKFDQIKMALVPDEALPPLSKALKNELGITTRQARMLRLSTPALTEALQNYSSSAVPIYLAGPEPAPGRPLPMRSVFIEQLQLQTGLNIDVESSKVFPMGRAGVFYAIDSAFEFFEQSGQKYILVGGVDTYWDAMTLAALSRDKRVQTVPGEMDAFVPGEGAGFLLLTSDEKNKKTSKVIYRPGVASEEGHRYSEAPYKGDGLSQAFNSALLNGAGDKVKCIVSSINGESFGAKEFGVAAMRNNASIDPEYNHQHPADCFGDLGGACGAVHLALTLVNESSYTLCYGASDGEFRGAACVA